MQKKSAAVGPQARRDGIVSEPIGSDDGLLLFDTTTNRAHHLDAAAARVWDACDGTRTLEALGQSTGLGDAVTRETVARLAEIGLITDATDAGHTRRTLIRGAVAAGLVAAPIILSVDVPSAAMAASAFTPTTLNLAGTFGDSSGAGSAITYRVAPDGSTTTLPYNTSLYVSTTTGLVTTTQPTGAYVEFSYAYVSAVTEYSVSVYNMTGATISYGYTGTDAGDGSGFTLPNNTTVGIPYNPGATGTVTVNL